MVSDERLIQEAGLGLMKAADKFDPTTVSGSQPMPYGGSKSIQDYVMRNWSMVRTGSTTTKSRCFSICAVFAQLNEKPLSAVNN